MSAEEHFARKSAREIVLMLPNFFYEDSGFQDFQHKVDEFLFRRKDRNFHRKFYSFLNDELQHVLEKHSLNCENKHNPLDCLYFRVYSRSLSYINGKSVSL